MAGKQECELIRTDKYNSNSTYSHSNDFHHFFITIPCGSGETVCRNGGTCYPVYEVSSYKCVCPKGYNGRHCETKQAAKTCLGWLQNGYKESGLYLVSGKEAYCDMTTDGGGWRVFLRRKDGTMDFDRSYNAYKHMFGNLKGEFWYGVQNLRNLVSSRSYELRVDLEDWEGNTAYANYAVFKIDGRSTQYSLRVDGYSGTAGDSLSSANGMGFSTKDSDHDGNDTANCAEVSKAGWWFSNCYQALLTGPYSHTPQGGNGIIWKDWKGFNYSLKSCEMKMRALGNLK
ncbi:microfibril-associated glycoprotein 4-like [Oculina patagonica]